MSIPKDVSTELPMFSDLTDAELSIIVQHMDRMELEPGATIFTEGEPGTCLLLVLDGKVEVKTKISGEVERILLTLNRGGVFGELALITGEARTGTAKVAEEKAVLLTLESDKFATLCKKHVKLANKIYHYLLKTVASRLNITTQLFRHAAAWGLNISGAIELNYHQLIVDKKGLRIDLNSGASLSGTLLKVDRGTSGDEFFVKLDKGGFAIVPYHAVTGVVFDE